MRIFRNILIMGMALAGITGEASGRNAEALPFVRIVHDPASAGMGFAGVASVSGTAYSSFRNPTAIPFSEERMSIGVSGQMWAPDGARSTNLGFGAAFKAGKRFGFSLGGAYQMGEKYSLTDETGNITGTFKPDDMILNGGVGVKVFNNLAVGANVRYAMQRFSEGKPYSAMAADIFMTYRLSDLNITVGVSSLGSSVKSESGDSFSIPTSATIGADWSKALSRSHGVRLAADVDYFFSGNVTAAAGAEYSFRNMLFARAGYHFGTKDAVLPSFATIGFGAKFFGISLDIAYLTANDILGNTLTFGIGYRF